MLVEATQDSLPDHPTNNQSPRPIGSFCTHDGPIWNALRVLQKERSWKEEEERPNVGGAAGCILPSPCLSLSVYFGGGINPLQFREYSKKARKEMV